MLEIGEVDTKSLYTRKSVPPKDLGNIVHFGTVR